MYLKGFPAKLVFNLPFKKHDLLGHSKFEDIHKTVGLVALLKTRWKSFCGAASTCLALSGWQHPFTGNQLRWSSCVGSKMNNLESFVKSTANLLWSFGLFGMWVCFKLLNPYKPVYRKWILWASHFKHLPLGKHPHAIENYFIENMGGLLCQVMSLKRLAHFWNMW